MRNKKFKNILAVDEATKKVLTGVHDDIMSVVAEEIDRSNKKMISVLDDQVARLTSIESAQKNIKSRITDQSDFLVDEMDGVSRKIQSNISKDVCQYINKKIDENNKNAQILQGIEDINKSMHSLLLDEIKGAKDRQDDLFDTIEERQCELNNKVDAIHLTLKGFDDALGKNKTFFSAEVDKIAHQLNNLELVLSEIKDVLESNQNDSKRVEKCVMDELKHIKSIVEYNSLPFYKKFFRGGKNVRK